MYPKPTLDGRGGQLSRASISQACLSCDSPISLTGSICRRGATEVVLVHSRCSRRTVAEDYSWLAFAPREVIATLLPSYPLHHLLLFRSATLIQYALERVPFSLNHHTMGGTGAHVLGRPRAWSGRRRNIRLESLRMKHGSSHGRALRLSRQGTLALVSLCARDRSQPTGSVDSGSLRSPTSRIHPR